MPDYFVDGARGSDTASGTSEATAWKSLANSTRLKPGDTLTALPGTITGTFAPPSGTAAAPITLRAKEPGTVTVDGSVRIDGLGWTRIAKGFQTPFSRLAFNVFQRTFESDGKRANFNNRDFNQYGSNPRLDLHGTPAEFKWAGGSLRLNAIPSTPQAEPLFAAITEVAINLNGRSHVNVEGIVTRGHKHAVATNGGTGIHFKGCRFTFCGSTAVWLVGLSDASMVGCVVQGAGSWEGHYEDCIHVSRVGNLRLEGLNFSYGGHSGIIMLDGVAGKIVLRRCYGHAMGGSLLTLKRNVNGLLVEDCWLADAAKSTAVDAHKVPHAGVQLSGKNHVFRNCVFRDNGKDILASSDGNPDSNPVCSDNQFDHCTFSGSEAGAVEGQEYAPAGRLERNTWRDCIIKGDVALFYAGAGDHASNKLVHCQVVGSTNRGVILSDCSSGPLPGTGSSLTEPPTGTSPTPPIPPIPPIPPPTGDRPVLRALVPISGAPGVRVTATGERFGSGPEVLVPVPDGARRLSPPGGTDTEVSWNMPADVVTGEVRVRNGSLLSNPLVFTRTGSTPPVPPDPPVPPIPPPASELTVSLVAVPSSGKGATFSGVCSERPVRISVLARTTDGRTAIAEAMVAGDTPVPPVEPPPGDLPEAVREIIRIHNDLRQGAVFPPLAAMGMAAEEGEIGEPWTGQVSPREMSLTREGEAAAAAGPLADQAQLRKAAQDYAERMAKEGFFSHTSPDGGTPWQRIAAAGYTGRTLGENIARGFSSAEAVMRAWMGSSGHAANVLNPAFTHIGVGISGTVWVVDFGG